MSVTAATMSGNRWPVSVIRDSGTPMTRAAAPMTTSASAMRQIHHQRTLTSVSVPPAHGCRGRRLAKKTVPANAKSTVNRANVSRPSATSMNRYMTEKDAAIQMATLRIVHTLGTVAL